MPFLPPRQYPIRFGFKLVELRPFLVGENAGKPDLPAATIDELVSIFKSLDWANIWKEARMGEVCRYMRGSTHLRLPKEYKEFIPASI